jgi:hypothetical protein
MCFGQYQAGKPPKFLHFEYEGSTNIHRYMLVDIIPSTAISPVTKRCQGEGNDEQLRIRYLNPAPLEPSAVSPEEPDEPEEKGQDETV